MKKSSILHFGAGVLAALLLLPQISSCVKEAPEDPESVETPDDGEGAAEDTGLVRLEFDAEAEDESRTVLSGSTVLWKGTDKLAVLDNASPYVHQFDNTNASSSARSRFVGEAANATNYTIVYPLSAYARKTTDQFYVTIPATQKAVANGFADGAYLTYARSASKSFTMSPYCALLKVVLAYNNIKRVEVTGNANNTFTGTVRPLSGRYYISNNASPGNHLTYYDGGAAVALVPADGQSYIPAGTYYLAVAPMGGSGNSQGAVANMRLTFTRTDNQTASRSTTGANLVFSRGKYTDFDKVDELLSWGYFDFEFGTSSGRTWPFTQYRTSTNGGSTWSGWANQPSPLTTVLQRDVEYKSKDSGHVLRAHSSGEAIRYADNANALYIGAEVGNYLQFPAINNRALRRVVFYYDSTYVYNAQTGWPYCKSRASGDCPHIQTTGGSDISYLLSRDGNGFHHAYDLYGTSVGAAYRYVLAINGGAFTGPRIQRIRLYYSKTAAEDPLTLPSAISVNAYSTALRKSTINVSMTASDANRAANSSDCQVGFVIRNFRKTADASLGTGHTRDTVVYLSSVVPSIAGSTLSWSLTNFHTYNDDLLNEQYAIFPFVRIKGDSTNPITMTPGSSGTNWRAGALTYIYRPSYSFTTDTSTNYLYASDTQVNLKATVTVSSSATQNYDVGFIYRVDGGNDSSWNYTYVDQNGSTKATITGYSLANGASKTYTATVTGLTAGQAYEYKPVIRQHAACKFGTNESSEAPTFKYLLYAAGYDNSNTRITDINGPVIGWGAASTSGHYTAAKTGSITAGNITVAHVASGSSVSTGWLYGTTASLGSTASTVSKTLASTMAVDATTNLSGLTDAPSATAYYRPYLKFTSGSRQYNPGTNRTFTAPTCSVTSGNYLWREALKADLGGTISVTDANTKLEIGYYNGSTWTTSATNQTAGAKTISSATLENEGPQTVKFGVRLSGSTNASSWQSVSISLTHPVTSAYTYGSSFWPSGNSSVQVSGSFVPAGNAATGAYEYGIAYYLSNATGTIRSVYASETGSVQSYYTLTLTQDVSNSTNRTPYVHYWFFARLKNSTVVPGAKNTTSGSAKSSPRAASTYYRTGNSTDKWLLICFKETHQATEDGYINPFLPTTASGYISALNGSITSDGSQTKKALLTGGLTLEFHLNSADAYYPGSGTKPISGAWVSNLTNAGNLRVYSNSIDDYIAFPAISGRRIKLFHSVAASTVVKEDPDYTSVVTNTTTRRLFLTTNDRTVASHNSGFNTASPSSGLANGSWNTNDISGFTNASYTNSYNGTSQRLHFCGEHVGAQNTWPSTACQPWENRFRYIGVGYAE